jgi:fructokinase
MYLGLSLHNTHIDTAVHLGGGEFVLPAEIPLAGLARRDSGAAIRSIEAHIRPYGPVTAIGALYAPDVAPTDQQADKLTLTLQAALNAPAHIATPAESLGLYETRFGVAADSHLTCCLYLDRRLSGSICFGHRLWRGANRLVGRWGHLPLAFAVEEEHAAAPCECGRTGCLEGFVSTTAIEADYHRATGIPLDIKAIATADRQDLVASSVLQILDDRLGRTTASIINMFDPEVIVFGGQLAALDRLYTNLPRKWPGYLLAQRATTKLVKHSIRTRLLARGAACFAETVSSS